jgi:hypothetical protein
MDLYDSDVKNMERNFRQEVLSLICVDQETRDVVEEPAVTARMMSRIKMGHLRRESR